MTGSDDDVFHIGFALSGAISAGAYTAGVLDFFFQACNAREGAEEQTGTRHRTVVEVIAGASAGAITGALGAIALARGLQRPTTPPDAPSDLQCVLPSLYQTWVVMPRMVDPDGGIDFLSAEDLEGPGSQVVSALNACLLSTIKDMALRAPSAAPVAQPPYSFVAADLHVYMTISNLRGIPFTVDFGGDSYGMQSHGDRVHYRIAGLGSGTTATNAWLASDTSQALTIATLPTVGQDVPADWDRYGTCALASAAFPVGLAPRVVETTLADYIARAYPMQHGAGTIKPRFPPGMHVGVDPNAFVYLSVDGGIVNNNPFDYAQYALMGEPTATKTAPADSDRAVIMVSPFPEPPDFLAEGLPHPEIVAVLQALYPALIDQARFKPAELLPAMDPFDHSRFLIAPKRSVGGVEQRYKIACGLLSGFGGFLDETFRAHDFQLGRRNCQAFLGSAFTLGGDNKLLNPLATPGASGARPPIIPLCGDALAVIPLLPWPRMSAVDFATLLRRIKGRFDKLAPRFIQAQTSSRLLRALGRFGVQRGQSRVLHYIRLAILSDLVRRDQIAGWDLPQDYQGATADDVRLVLAALLNPAFTFRTPTGLAKATHLALPFVTAVLARLQGGDVGEACRVWSGVFENREVYALASRRPGWLQSLPGIGAALRWLDEPAVD